MNLVSSYSLNSNVPDEIEVVKPPGLDFETVEDYTLTFSACQATNLSFCATDTLAVSETNVRNVN